MEISSGILVYRIKNEKVQVLLGKCGGPAWARRVNSWNIPKGHVENNEDLFETAKREFQEETSLIIKNRKESDYYYLGESSTTSKKHVHVYTIEYDFPSDKDNNVEIISNICETEWPKKSGNIIQIPELSEAKYFDIDYAKTIIFPYQIIFLDRLENYLDAIL